MHTQEHPHLDQTTPKSEGDGGLRGGTGRSSVQCAANCTCRVIFFDACIHPGLSVWHRLVVLSVQVSVATVQWEMCQTAHCSCYFTKSVHSDEIKQLLCEKKGVLCSLFTQLSFQFQLLSEMTVLYGVR